MHSEEKIRQKERLILRQEYFKRQGLSSSGSYGGEKLKLNYNPYNR